MEGRGLSEPPPPPPALAFSPAPSFSLALPTPRTLRRKEGELPGVLRGELLAVLETGKQTTKKKGQRKQIRSETLKRKQFHFSQLDSESEL